MVKIAAFVHKNYINQVMYEVGKLESLQLIDAHRSLKEFKEPEISEPSDYSIKIASILSRADYLESLLKVKFRVKKKLSIPVESVDALLKWSEEKIALMEKEVYKFQNETARLDKEGLSNSEKETIIQAMLIGLFRQVGVDLETITETLETQQRIEEAKALMVRTKNVYCFEGWVPEERLDKVVKTIKESAGGYGDIIYVKKPPPSVEVHKDYEAPPSMLKYPKITGVFLVFSGLTKAFGLPSYYEIDPTLPFLITFPIIFGLMFGDVGHGAILLASGITLYLLKGKLTLKFKPGSLLYYVIAGAPLIAMNGAAAMLIGFLYGELFGSEEWFHALTGLPGPLWFSPYHYPMKLLKYSIMAGVFQISLGLVLDLIGKLSSRRFKEAITGPIPWLWLYWSGSYLVFSYGWDVFKVILDISIIGPYILLPFGVLATLKFVMHGISGVTEALEAMVMSFSNTVSYARILALKMIHTAFSILFLPTSLIGMIIFPIGTLFLIMIFEGMLAFLHTLRLHWIEWFTKFYSGKGKPFQPFTTLGRYPTTA